MAKTLDEHYGYLSDRGKIEKYRAAIERVVRPEHAVLDLGCGSGLLGLMALRAGARRVIFVDEASVIEIARRTVLEAGYSDRVEFIQATSFELSLPDKVDMVVCDHIGYFGIDYGVLALLADACERFLKPGGIVVPSDLDLMLAPVESESCRNLTARWQDGSVPGDYEWLGTTEANTRRGVRLEPGELLDDTATLVTLELGQVAASYLSWTAEFVCNRDGMLDGIAGWFDCRLTDDIRMTNSPVAPERLDRRQAFLPLESAVKLGKGDRVIIYMPMIPEAVVAMLACARIGAIHSVVFGGFAAKELATRVVDAKPKLIVSATCGIEAARVIPYLPLLTEALDIANAPDLPRIIVSRPELPLEVISRVLVFEHHFVVPCPVAHRQVDRASQEHGMAEGEHAVGNSLCVVETIDSQDEALALEAEPLAENRTAKSGVFPLRHGGVFLDVDRDG